jgi:hypothetical protein
MDDNFTYRNYSLVLDDLKTSGYRFLSGKQILENHSEKCAIIRHDVDFILNPVLPMAKLESEQNIRGTYFFLTNAPLYNLLSDEGFAILEYLKSHQHDIGIHLDSAGILTADDLKRSLEKELTFFTKFLQIDPTTVSYHMPSPEIMAFKEPVIHGLVNFYAQELFERFNYLSDSNGYWRQKTLPEFLKDSKNKNIYLLTHPVWWGKEASTPKERLHSAMGSANSEFEHWYVEVCKKYNRKYW